MGTTLLWNESSLAGEQLLFLQMRSWCSKRQDVPSQAAQAWVWGSPDQGTICFSSVEDSSQGTRAAVVTLASSPSHLPPVFPLVLLPSNLQGSPGLRGL